MGQYAITATTPNVVKSQHHFTLYSNLTERMFEQYPNWKNQEAHDGCNECKVEKVVLYNCNYEPVLKEVFCDEIVRKFQRHAGYASRELKSQRRTI